MALTSAQSAVLEQLHRHELLRRFDAEDLRALVGHATVKTYDEREILFSQGEAGQTVLVVVHGYAKLSALTSGGREIVLDVVGPGDVFGELAVLTDQPRAATAVALAPCALLALDGRAFTHALERSPEAMFWMIRLLGRRVNRTTEQMTDGLDLPAPVRLAKALLELSAMRSKPVKDGLRIELTLSQRELGGMTGLIRESINKHLGTWRDAGWLSLSGRAITLHNVGELRAVARDEGEQRPSPAQRPH
jgi:CRP/FNR family cyclic AMP-dependent transcriptional regulator